MQMILQIPMQRPPTLETLENSLRLFQMIVQGLWPRNSTLLQLPHISEHNIPFLRKVFLFVLSAINISCLKF